MGSDAKRDAGMSAEATESEGNGLSLAHAVFQSEVCDFCEQKEQGSVGDAAGA